MNPIERPNVEGSSIAYDAYFKVKVDELYYPQKDLHTLHSTIALETDAVMVLAKTKEGKWVINRELRHSTGKILYSTPGGRLENGEEAAVGAKREFLEETGYETDELVSIGRSYPFPGLCSQQIFFFYGENAHRVGDPQPEPGESFETIELDSTELRSLLGKGSNNDGILLTALMFYEINKERLSTQVN
jgi:ADP-ribose pyrophosphatase